LLASPANCQKKRYSSESTREWPSLSVTGAGDVESVIYNSTWCPAEGGMPDWRLRRDDNYQFLYAELLELADRQR